MAEDIRWKQRLDNYSKALRQLTRFIDNVSLRENIERVGVVFYERAHM